jgi:hypothetical protein
MSDREFGDSAWIKGKFPDDYGVEVRILPEAVHVRSTRDPDEVLRFTPDEWTLFLRGVKRGEFD